jgi:hypothetical protein
MYVPRSRCNTVFGHNIATSNKRQFSWMEDDTSVWVLHGSWHHRIWQVHTSSQNDYSAGYRKFYIYSDKPYKFSDCLATKHEY